MPELLQLQSTGVQEQPIQHYTSPTWDAVGSVLVTHALPMDIASVTQFQQVTDFFQTHQTVMPLRYGAVFADAVTIIQHLQEQQEFYTVLHENIDGCCEISIRVLIADSTDQERRENNQPASPEPNQTSQASPGAAFLRQRQRHYEQLDAPDFASQAGVEQITNAMAGLYRRKKMQTNPDNKADHTVHFLVPVEDVAGFMQQYQILNADSRLKLLLSGPWAPYNFVL